MYVMENPSKYEEYLYLVEFCNTLVLTPNALNVYIVINRGVELKEKSPPLIYRFMFRRLKSMPMVFFC